ncbi:MAG: hypothetical protein P9M07_01605 [Candidatus Aceula meridiana]|nr:hypothetical protein [Candidatus Aceula meridiana]
MKRLEIEKQQVLYLIESDPDYRKYFFVRVKSLDWFDALKEAGYFDPATIEYDENGDAYFWDVLDYLERVSEQADKVADKAEELLKIINMLVDYSKFKRKISNYHIWWYCVKVLNNIPNDIIVEHLVPKNDTQHFEFKYWLEEWVCKDSNNDLTISDISEKLLKKFLSDERTVSLAVDIIDVITDIKRSDKNDYLTKRPGPMLKGRTFWILKSLKNQAGLIGRVCGKDTILLLANKLQIALECKRESSYAVFEIDKDVYRLEVIRKRKSALDCDEIIEYVPNLYKVRLDKYAESQLEKNDEKIDCSYLYRIDPLDVAKKEEEIEFDSHSGFISEVKNYLPSSVEWRKDAKYEKRLNNIYNGLFEDYSQVWFKSIEEGGSDHASGAAEVLTIVVRDILLSKYENDHSAGKHIVDMFLSDLYVFPIFNKLALYCIGKYWDRDNMEKFKGFIASHGRALDDSDWEVEVFDILKNHNNDFDDALIELIKKQIQNVPEYYQQHEDYRMIAQWQFNRLSPLKDNKHFKLLYDETAKKAKSTKEYAPERSAIQGGFVSHSSPLSSSEIIKKPNSELVEYLCEYKGADFWHGAFEGEPDREGLANAVQAAVKEKPDKFTADMNLFYDVPYYYAHYLMWGLREAWNDNKDLDWKVIFDFSLKYLKRPKLIEEAMADQGSDSGKGKYVWFIEDVVKLIHDGARNDERAFDPQFFPLVEDIFEIIIPLLKVDQHPQIDRDVMSDALNTTLGKVVESFISFSLRIARVEKRKPEGWGEKYDRFFEKGIEAYVWFGRYLRNTNYLDEAFTLKKIRELSSPDELGVNWQAFMGGYLKGSYVYDEFYESMRENYVKAINNQIPEDYADKRLVQHIAIWYIRGKEDLGGRDSLFRMMLEDVSTPEKKSRWLEVVSFFWSLSKKTLKEENEDEDPSQETKDKILDFWTWTAEQASFVEMKLGDQYGSFLGRLSELTILISDFNSEAEKLLSLSVPHIERHHEATFLIEYLTKYKRKDELERIGRIYLNMLDKYTPTFKKEHIQLIITSMYNTKDSKLKESADNICNIYGRRGVHFLKDIYFKFN